MKPIRALGGAVLVLMCTAMPTFVAAEELQDIRLGIDGPRNRLVFDLSGPAEYSVKTLEDPLRVVLELATATHAGPAPQVAFAGTPISGMAISYGQPSGLLVTLDLHSKVSVESFLLRPYENRGYRLVIDLYAAGNPANALADTESGTAHATSPNVSAPVKRPSSASSSARETVSRRTSSAAPIKPTSGPSYEFSGTWQQEWAYQTENTGNQKFEALIQPRLDIGFDSGSQLVVIGRVRLDAVGDLGPDEHRPDNYSDVNGPIYNDKYAELSLRELYYDTRWAGAYWRLGKQQVVWGQADGIKVLDVVNPQSFREFILDDFDDSRIPLWMVNAELPLSKGSLQFLWIPDTTYHELAEAGTPYFLTSPKWLPSVTPGTPVVVSSLDKPNNPLDDSDMGLRYSAFLGGWDLTLNYLYHYQDFPVLFQQSQQINGVQVTQINPTYKRNQLFGTTLSNAFDAFTLRAEVAYSTDTYHTTSPATNRGIANSDEVASVIGLDWQYSGDSLLSAQWFMSHLPDYNRDIVRGKSENNFSLLLQQGFANDTWQLRVLGLYSLDDEDSLIELKLKYWLLSDLEVWLGGDFFNGTQRGSFGQFDEQSRVLMGMEYGF